MACSAAILLISTEHLTFCLPQDDRTKKSVDKKIGTFYRNAYISCIGVNI